MEIGEEFAPEFIGLAENVQDSLLTITVLLKQFGPELKRPHADTLKGSRHANMKEVRFNAADGVWRVAYAFDLCARLSCSWQARKRGLTNGAFTVSWSVRPMNDLIRT